MKTLKATMIAAIAVITILGAHAQFQTEPTVMDKLIATKWKFAFPSEKQYEVFDTYAKTNLKIEFLFEGKTTTTNDPYYLSDTIDKTFDENKIGKVTDGRYIVLKNTRNDTHTVFEIVTLTTKELIIKNMNNSSICPYKAYPASSK